ncbi:MAG: hypothetical protein Q8O32_00295, partial [bacterium]|nr:hypothetical protein [bacterium]
MRDYKKIVFTLCLAIFVFTVLVTAQPTNAQLFLPIVPMPTFELESKPSILERIWNKIEKVYDAARGTIGAELAYRTVDMFLNTMAYDIATELATGGQGGKPMFRVKSMKDTMQKATESAAGEFIGALTEKGFDDLGINLCNPSASLKLTFTLSLIDSEAPPKPACEWRNIVREWGNFEQDVQNDLIKIQLRPGAGATSTRAFFQNLSENSELEDYLKLSTAFNNKKIAAEEELKLKIAECQGFVDKKTPVSEEVITHCQTYKELQATVFVNAPIVDAVNQMDKKEEATNQKWSSILRSAADRFTSTFTSKLLNYYAKQGIWSLFGNKDNEEDKDYRTTLLDRLRGGANLLQPRNSDILKKFKTIDIGQLESYDYLTNLTLCPDEFSNPDNCTLSPAFLQAVTAGISLEEAIEQGVINGNLSFIGPDDPMNGSKERCYQDALCHSNLIKLRKLNIIPVGWEMASMRVSTTLADAMNCFEDGGSCKYAKSADYAIDGVDHNPFYHLVDGNWILKAPDATCDAYVYSANLESPESSNRQQYCADPKSCLREDANGDCLDGQYGYCTRSENVWRLEAEECINGEAYAGCLTFGNADFGEASYIESTLDSCTADEAGCRRYSQEQANDGSWILGDIANDDNDLFLNKQASSCEADQAGCSEFIILAANTNANILPNGDFEIWNDITSAPDGYLGTGAYDDDDGVNGSNAVLAAYNVSGIHNVTCYGDLIVTPNTNYTVSVDVKINSADPGDGAARISLDGCEDINGDVGDISSPDNSMDLDNDPIADFDPAIDPADEANLLVPITKLSSSQYTRITGSFNSGNSAYCNSICVGSNYGNEKPHYFDNLKLEVVSVPKLKATYTSYGDGATVYMDNSLFMCLAEEVGCQGYTPTNGDPLVPAVLSPDDLCPAECVAYATFTEQTDIFDIMENPNATVDYYNFIPETAKSCPAQDVGCEEFTNLEEVAAGGEGREYYTYLRQCVPENFSTVYYTWEGTDVAGYQIKTWSALESNVDDAPCTNIRPNTDVCVDVVDTRAICGTETPLNPNDDPGVDPNCREFFDANGDSHFRFQDRVIFASNDCHEYRRTLSAQIYKAIPSLSVSCNASSNNCRSYYGNASNNVRVVFNDNFENGTYLPWEIKAGGSIDLSNESLSNNGHSLKITKTANTTTLWRDVADLLRNDKEYELSWWMKNNASINSLRVRLYAEDLSGNQIVNNVICDGNAENINSILLHDCDDLSLKNIGTGNWRKYTVANLVDILGPNVDLSTLKIAFDINGNLGDVFVDNIILKEVTDNFAVIRNSWQTPVSCDDPYVGYHLGCQAYIDTNNNKFNIKSFSRLCREQAIGCLPAIDTHNSSYPFEEIFNVGDFSELIVPDDSITYLVPDVASYCSPTLKGCSALGFESRQEPGQFETTYKINDPDRYSYTLCNYDSLGCEEYNSSKGSYYFKDPGINTCIYQENFSLNGSKFSGWFKSDTLTAFLPSGCSDDNDGVLEPDDLQFP